MFVPSLSWQMIGFHQKVMRRNGVLFAPRPNANACTSGVTEARSDPIARNLPRGRHADNSCSAGFWIQIEPFLKSVQLYGVGTR
jgi:hypothetical protein|eukprot:COSAG06_NODE_1336_length_9822_cov_2.335905_4_plen_84_part_00